MIKSIRRIMLLVLVFLLIFTGCTVEKEEEKSLNKIEQKPKVQKLENINQYNINVQFYPEEKTIKGTQSVTYINNEDAIIDKVYFHLYPNAFKKIETAPFLFDNFNNAYPRGFSEGYIDIDEVYIDGAEGTYSVGEIAETIMEVSLPHKLDIGDKITIDMKYTIKLPPATERFGYGNDTYNLGNWYPIVAVYDDSGWNLDPYYPIGDPFYSDVSNYKVTIRAPKDFVIASTGNVISNKVLDDVIEWSIEANSFRDFAWVASDNFQIIEEEIDGILVKMYFVNDGTVKEDIKEKALVFAKKSLETFNEVFGEYPYKEYSVVQTNFPSGMEYPGIVFIGSKFYDNSYIDFLEIVIVHETAHQWWYGVVGNDQVDQAWLDESFASYSEVIYFSESYGERIGERYQKSENEGALKKITDTVDNKVVLKTLKDFENWNDYGLLVYSKGAVFLDDIKDKYGKEVFYEILKTYYNRFKFKNATTKDFLNICEEVTGDDLDHYFEQWLK